MTNLQQRLASVSPTAQNHSDQLLSVIVDAIKTAGGQITFADYMQRCLYQPGLGYYSAGSYKIGQGGDFTTAPEISPLFSHALAYHTAAVLTEVSQGDCLEFGAGSGRMAIEVLRQLDKLDALPTRYYIIEASADLREKQQQAINAQLSAKQNRVVWLDQLPASFKGVILANEVCDAMPVHSLLFDHNSVTEYSVTWNNEQLEWSLCPVSTTALQTRAASLFDSLVDSPFRCEINLYAEAWLSSVADTLQQGAMFLIDYGHVARDYFQPSRAAGSVRCHFQQLAHDDPLILPGLQDITAHVNFTALAEAALANDLEVSGFQRQTDFLVAGEIAHLAQTASDDTFAQLQQAAALKRLLLPDQMGEIFKVLTLTKNLPLLPRLQQGDLRYQL